MFQTIIIVGNLGGDPEMRYLQSGQAVTNFNVATSRKYTGSDNQLVDETTWFRVSVWGRQAETCNQYLRKGSRVLIEGRLRPDPATGGPRIWTRQDGSAGASFEITASFVRFLSTRAEDSAYPRAGTYGDSPPPDVGEDDIPF
jgi:single-strand DNA-binding protein